MDIGRSEPVINKTIVSTLCVTAILVTPIITKAPLELVYAGMGLIAALNGVSIWKANHKPK